MNITGATLRATAAALALLPGAGCVTTHSPHLANPHAVEDAAADNVQLAMAYMQQGNLPRAKDKLDRAMSEDPKNPNLHSVYALFDERIGNLKKADEEFHEAMRLAPGDPDQLNFYAVFLCRNQRVDEGITKLLQVARNPLYRTPEAAYTNMGVCLRTAHRDDEALSAFQRSLALRPDFAEAVYQLADLDLAHGRALEARERIDTYLTTYNPTADLLVVAIRASRVLGDKAAAAGYVKVLLGAFPNSDQAREFSGQRPNSG